MIQLIKTVILSVILVTCLALKTEAITISGNGSFNIAYLVPKGTVGSSGALPFDLVGNSTWTITNYSSTGFDLSISMKNNTVVSPNYASKDARITAFGFNIDQDMDISKFKKGTAFLNYGTDTTLPSFGKVDMCIFGGNNCAGGSNGGLFAGLTDTVSFRLDLADCDDPVKNFTLTTFGMKWQTAWGSFEPEGCVGSSCNTTTISVEPESIFLILAGLGLMVVLSRYGQA